MLQDLFFPLQFYSKSTSIDFDSDPLAAAAAHGQHQDARNLLDEPLCFGYLVVRAKMKYKGKLISNRKVKILPFYAIVWTPCGLGTAGSASSLPGIVTCRLLIRNK
jgi:hypothetical protein